MCATGTCIVSSCLRVRVSGCASVSKNISKWICVCRYDHLGTCKRRCVQIRSSFMCYYVRRHAAQAPQSRSNISCHVAEVRKMHLLTKAYKVRPSKILNWNLNLTWSQCSGVIWENLWGWANRLTAASSGRLKVIKRCFRQMRKAERTSLVHNPEFSNKAKNLWKYLVKIYFLQIHVNFFSLQ